MNKLHVHVICDFLTFDFQWHIVIRSRQTSDIKYIFFIKDKCGDLRGKPERKLIYTPGFISGVCTQYTPIVNMDSGSAV